METNAGAPESTFFSTAFTEYYGSLATASNGDLWPSCWADDGDMYAANGDGTGFQLAGGGCVRDGHRPAVPPHSPRSRSCRLTTQGDVAG